MTPPRAALYGLGSLGGSLLLQTILLWAFPFYAAPPGSGRPLLLAPAVLGVALAAGRVVDAITNPLVAHWSDRLRTRWGRRRPFIAAAAPVAVLAFVLVWTPPAPGPGPANAAWAAGALALFFFAFTTVFNPYQALLADLTPEGAGRTELAAWQAGFNLAGLVVIYTTSSLLVVRLGFARMALIFGAAALPCLLAPALAVREPAASASSLSFLASVRTTLANRRLLRYLGALSSLWFGFSMLTLVVVLLVEVLMGMPRARAALPLGVAVGAALAGLPVVVALARRAGKVRVLAGAALAGGILLPLVGLVGRLPLGTAEGQGLVLLTLAGVPIAAYFALPLAILSDIAERRAGVSGHRGEGMHVAVFGLVLNTATGLAAAAVGVVLGRWGYGPGADLGLRLVPWIAAACLVAGGAALAGLRER